MLLAINQKKAAQAEARTANYLLGKKDSTTSHNAPQR